ncbi:uncharacterized protein ACHE_80092S [Aspergillus chevalieri]|uniref:Uncharacterized protein n=1 Tax=Aspergillus chevalieri TaxID=182096 RepID=A0A7R7ZT81_ASPCH|nr:uncharacterized protein ACHE_80092S [Aspergillus chevalieri]BCR92192.1 hypothetical protein ACHE_80092S [Aspergillus chevalieri]
MDQGRSLNSDSTIIAKSFFLSLFGLGAFVSAHTPPSDLALIKAHQHVTQKCSPKVGQMKLAHTLRRCRLSIDSGTAETDYTVHAQAPKYDFIRNQTSILTPRNQ